VAPTKINPDNIRAFKDAKSFHKWLGKHPRTFLAKK
jgi:hypothetical protein